MVKWIGIGLAVVGIITIAFIVAAYMYPGFREATRDIAIVILAVFQMIGALLTVALMLAILWAVFSIRKLAENTVMPKVDALSSKIDQLTDTAQSTLTSVKDTTSNLSTTTNYVAEQAVAPIIRVASLVAGARAAATFVARRGGSPSDDRKI